MVVSACYILGIVLSAGTYQLIQSSGPPLEAGAAILYKRKLRHREGRRFVQGHTSRKGEARVPTLAAPAPRPILLTTLWYAFPTVLEVGGGDVGKHNHKGPQQHSPNLILQPCSWAFVGLWVTESFSLKFNTYIYYRNLLTHNL